MKKVIVVLATALAIVSCAKQEKQAPFPTSFTVESDTGVAAPFETKSSVKTMAFISNDDMKDKGVFNEAWALVVSGDLTTYEEIYSALGGAFDDDELRVSISHMLLHMAAAATAGCAWSVLWGDGTYMLMDNDC